MGSIPTGPTCHCNEIRRSTLRSLSSWSRCGHEDSLKCLNRSRRCTVAFADLGTRRRDFVRWVESIAEVAAVMPTERPEWGALRPCLGVPVNEGDIVDDFELLDQHGQSVTLNDLVEAGPVVMFFYPKAMTPG